MAVLYQHFPSKDALYEAALNSFREKGMLREALTLNVFLSKIAIMIFR